MSRPYTAINSPDRGHGTVALRPRLPSIRPLLQETGLIPAIRKPENLDKALAAHGKIIYLLCGEPENIGDLMQRTLDAGKLPIVNIDLVAGLSRDIFALHYLERRGAKGIISTHGETLRQAQSLGLYVIQRTFLLDSGAMDNICHQIKNSSVDALEVLPAIAAPKLVDRAKTLAVDTALVGGGLISSLREVEDLLAQGLLAVSVSDLQLWIP
ncbi:glycerol-3-phosphate responsive antiterminator [Telmatospirillum sp.]|uniref:glycerol-3-phosphate responsive antiterminator n=1 Tax=Telmatospirillum sp. TaxID=2079197 RepID=UPI002840ABFA|nr:glycerol-3-phosphate responsive antiterminator [Telmatospirillum sp.]MDR3436738.1 glycerol-3-phosphate responsive antiterminator [Telmatospirillum sp.]